MSSHEIRVLVAKPGLDGHDRGIKVIASALREAGIKVLYAGGRQTPQTIAEAAMREEVDVVGVSFLNGLHNLFCAQIVSMLRSKGARCIVLVGGLIPQSDIPTLKAQGVSEVFLPGTPASDVVAFIRENVAA